MWRWTTDEMKRRIKNLNQKSKFWLDDIEFTGNETAYSDKLIEEILKRSDKVRQIYKGEQI